MVDVDFSSPPFGLGSATLRNRHNIFVVISAFSGDLGMFFNDLSYVYPPPGGDEDRRKDLFGVLSRFLTDCSKAQQDIATEGLCLSVKDVKAKAHEKTEATGTAAAEGWWYR